MALDTMQLRLLIAFIFRYILLIIHKFNKMMTYCYKNIKKLICFPVFLYLLPLSPIIELFSISIEMRSVFRSFASEIDLEG